MNLDDLERQCQAHTVLVRASRRRTGAALARGHGESVAHAVACFASMEELSGSTARLLHWVMEGRQSCVFSVSIRDGQGQVTGRRRCDLQLRNALRSCDGRRSSLERGGCSCLAVPPVVVDWRVAIRYVSKTTLRYKSIGIPSPFRDPCHRSADSSRIHHHQSRQCCCGP